MRQQWRSSWSIKRFFAVGLYVAVFAPFTMAAMWGERGTSSSANGRAVRLRSARRVREHDRPRRSALRHRRSGQTNLARLFRHRCRRDDFRDRSARVDRRHGGVIDVAFIGSTAYALVTGVGEDLGESDIVGIYRVDGPNSSTSSPTSARSPWPIRRPPTSSSRPDSSTRSKPTEVGSWSPTDTTIGCCGSRRWRDHRTDRVRQPCPDRPRRAWRGTGCRGAGRPDPAPAQDGKIFTFSV